VWFYFALPECIICFNDAERKSLFRNSSTMPTYHQPPLPLGLLNFCFDSRGYAMKRFYFPREVACQLTTSRPKWQKNIRQVS